MPDYINSHDYDIHLVGPDGKKITIRRGSIIRLPQFFDRYIKRGFIKRTHSKQSSSSIDEIIKLKKYRPSRDLITHNAKDKSQHIAKIAMESARNTQQQNHIGRKTVSNTIRRINKSRSKAKQIRHKTVGKGHKSGATESLHKTLSTTFYPISNGIGVGILSFNRPGSLRRLVSSIVRLTDLTKTTIFISDDGSTNVELNNYLVKLSKTNNFVILNNNIRLGVAGNSNRLLRCLSRFKCKILLNDDVEVLKKGWEHFYFRVMKDTNIHHFCFNQPGVYGAQEGTRQLVGNNMLVHIGDRPHGAVMAIDHKAFLKVGYFDEKFGYYGMEHVDWSSRVSATSIQSSGYWDAGGSNEYFKIHQDRSAVPDRIKQLQLARLKYANMVGRSNYISASSKSEVPSISCVIPFKDIGRHESIVTTINNIRAQRYPCIEMIAVEQDDHSHFSLNELYCVEHLLLKTPGRPFNKSMAFNAGVARATSDKLLLHDADTLVPAHYVSLVCDALNHAESCHFGARVIYADKRSTDAVNTYGCVDKTITADKIVSYFEGGSIACMTNIFWRVGGFVEGYWGYGCFAPGAPVLMPDGTNIPIEQINAGDEVVTSSGIIGRVNKIFKREYHGTAYKLVLEKCGYELIVTGEHPVWALQRQSLTKEGKLRKGAGAGWLPVAKLQEGDYVAVRRSHSQVDDISCIHVIDELLDNDHIIRDGLVFPTRDILGHKSIIDGSAYGLPATLLVDSHFLQFLGAYAAGGCASAENGIRISLHKCELDCEIGHIVCSYIEKLGLKYTINDRGNGIDIQCFCLPLVRLLQQWFPGERNDKRFPSWVMYLPAVKQWDVLRGLLSGGAEHGRQVRLNMDARHLVEQAVFLAERCGINPSFSHYNYESFLMAIARSCTQADKWSELGFESGAVSRRTKFIDNNTYVRVHTCEATPYSGMVHNLEIENEHTYVIGYGQFHNCEDCDFYLRLSKGSRWYENRIIDLIHLWHGRTSGWVGCHDINKEFERTLAGLSVIERIQKQHKYFKNTPFTKFVNSAISKQ